MRLVIITLARMITIATMTETSLIEYIKIVVKITTQVQTPAGKIYLISPLERIPLQINLKCDPEKAVELREQFESVQPGYHMSKKHWNTVIINGSIPEKELQEWINHSYELVVSGLKKSDIKKLKE